MVVLNLDVSQVGQQVITLSTAQLLSIHAQEAAGTTTPPVIQPPASNGGARTYQLSKLNDDDKRWLRLAMWQYGQDLRVLRGAHQLLEDMLVDGRGFNVTDHAPNSPLQDQINLIKNRILAGGDLYDPNYGTAQAALYIGPLKQIYANLVSFKLTGK